jgi:CRISPR-associated protein Csd1
VALDIENTNPGYRLGRLMAVLERVQGVAQKNPNKTIVDRYYGSASTRPGTVFPRLVAMAQHHLKKLTEGMEVYYQKRLGQVMDGISDFPRVLSLEDQGRFALGYYHQKQEFFKKADSESASESEEEI